MTASEKLERMERCAYCQNGDCLLYGYPPFDCGYCVEFVDGYAAELGDREVEHYMSASNMKVYVPTEELWSFYLENIERCENEMILIAENTDTKYAVYLTDEDGKLMLSVCKGTEEPEYEEYVLNDDDCANTVKKLLFRYLIPFKVVDGGAVPAKGPPDGTEEDEANLSRQDMEDKIYEREDELDLALKDFLAVVLQEEDGEAVLNCYGQALIEEILDHFLEYLAKEQCLEISRPMFILDEETGSEIYAQFPYDEDGGYEPAEEVGEGGGE